MVQKRKPVEGGDPTAAKRPRGRPRAYDPETALAQAAEVFWKKGYDGTSLDDLAAATGMNRPSLYAAFGDKHALYLTTLQRYRDEARRMSLSLLEDKPALRVYLARFYKAALDLYTRGGARDLVAGLRLGDHAREEGVGAANALGDKGPHGRIGDRLRRRGPNRVAATRAAEHVEIERRLVEAREIDA